MTSRRGSAVGVALARLRAELSRLKRRWRGEIAPAPLEIEPAVIPIGCVLLTEPGLPLPDGFATCLRVDMRGKTLRPAGEAVPLPGPEEGWAEAIWLARRRIAGEVVEAFFARLTEAEAEALGPYRSGLEGAIVQRNAARAFLEVIDRHVLDGRSVAVCEGGSLLAHARPWLQDRGATYVVGGERTGRVVPPVRPPMPRRFGGSLFGRLRDVGSLRLPSPLRPKGRTLALTLVSHPTHAATLLPVVEALRASEGEASVMLMDVAEADTASFSDRQPGIAAALAREAWRVWERDGPELSPGLRELMVAAIRRDLYGLVVMERILRALGVRRGARLLGTTDSFFLSDFARERAAAHGVERITLQNAFLSTSARYTRPATDRLMAIDTASRDFFVREMAIDPGSLDVVGSVRFAELARERDLITLPEASKADWLAEQGFPETATLIAFAAQPAAFSTGALAFLQAMQAAFGDRRDLAFAIRLHPKALPEEIDAVTAFLATTSLQAALDGRGILPFLKTADGVVTEFSNMGLEAAILGRPLVILKTPDAPDFPPLDAYGIGRVETDLPGVAAALDALATLGPEAAGFPDPSRRFAAENPGLWHGDAVARIVARLDGEALSPA